MYPEHRSSTLGAVLGLYTQYSTAYCVLVLVRFMIIRIMRTVQSTVNRERAGRCSRSARDSCACAAQGPRGAGRARARARRRERQPTDAGRRAR